MNLILIYAVLILIIAGVIAGLWFSGHKNTVFQLAFLTVEQAEKWFGDGKGREQFHWVYTQLKPKIPEYLSWYFTENKLREIIENAVQKLKLQLGDKAGIVNPGLLRIEQAKAVSIFAQKATTDWIMNLSDAETRNVAQLSIDAVKKDINNEIFANVKLQTDLKGYTDLTAGVGTKITW